MNKGKIVIISILSIILTGCVSPRQMTLFVTSRQGIELPKRPQNIAEIGDVLSITFTAIIQEAVDPYNSSGTIYLVNEEGKITVPVLGDVDVLGKTEEEIVNILTDMIRSQVQNPVIVVEFANSGVTIMGEVKAPNRLTIKRPITMIEALGYVGGVTLNAKCKDIVVYRREHGKINTYHVNLLTDEIYSSPCYYLQKGDLVYVTPLHAKRY